MHEKTSGNTLCRIFFAVCSIHTHTRLHCISKLTSNITRVDKAYRTKVTEGEKGSRAKERKRESKSFFTVFYAHYNGSSVLCACIYILYVTIFSKKSSLHEYNLIYTTVFCSYKPKRINELFLFMNSEKKKREKADASETSLLRKLLHAWWSLRVNFLNTHYYLHLTKVCIYIHAYALNKARKNIQNTKKNLFVHTYFWFICSFCVKPTVEEVRRDKEGEEKNIRSCFYSLFPLFSSNSSKDDNADNGKSARTCVFLGASPWIQL